MKTMGLILGIIFSILIFGSINFYIGLRGWQKIGSLIPFLNSRIYWILFWILACTFIIAKLGEKYLPHSIEKCIAIIGNYYMAAMMYLLIILPIIDLIRFGERKYKLFPEAIMKNRILVTYYGAAIFILLTIILIYGTFNARKIKMVHYDININKKAGNLKSLRIAMLSDSHLGDIVNNNRLKNMVEKINELNPDIVLMAGDIVDEKVAPFLSQNMGDTLKNIKSTYGVYAVTGNHEFYGGDADKIVKALEGSNINVLRDESIKIDNSFYIVGREDVTIESYLKQKRKTISELLNEEDKNLPIILLDHQPLKLKEAEDSGVDLQLSGHTHRGQMFPNQYFTRILYEVDYGYKKKGDYNIIVSSGIGTWGPPVRIDNSSELLDIFVNFKTK